MNKLVFLLELLLLQNTSSVSLNRALNPNYPRSWSSHQHTQEHAFRHEN